jgi:hypothetical protein
MTEGTDYVVLWDYSERTTHSFVGIYYDDGSQRGGYQVDLSGGTWPNPWSPTMLTESTPPTPLVVIEVAGTRLSGTTS